MNSGARDFEDAGAILTVDLGALADNWRLLAKHAGASECAAVVKADAYGLGIAPAARALHGAGARTFFVALMDEARRLREAVPHARIHVLNGLAPGAAPRFVEIGANPVLGSADEVAEWAQAGGGPAVLHVDTGMNRLGLTLDKARAFAAAPPFVPSLIMSHLACADVPDHALNARQVARFREVAALFPGTPASLANSAGTLLGGDYLMDLCRPGVALYGSNPLSGRPNPLKPVVRVEARIIQVRSARAGETVGYGAAETMGRDSRVAVLSLGYADGIPRAAGSRDGRSGARISINGHSCPLVGRISMDLIAVDVTKAGTVRRGDIATVIGPDNTVDDLAEAAGTIGYEILTGLGRRYRRIYLGS